MVDFALLELAARARKLTPPSNGKLVAHEAPPANDAALPTIRTGLDLHRVVDDACAALAAADVYQRDGELVRVVRAIEPDHARGILVGAPTIRPVTIPTMRELLTRVAAWERYDSRADDYRPCSPPDSVTAAVLARGEYRDVRPLVAVSETPFLRPDGTICAAEGYDPATGMVHTPACDVPSVPDRPTQADCMRALVELCDVVADFPFVDEAARYVPIAAILTMIARPAIGGAIPLVVLDATTRGSGKTLLENTVATIATGRSAPVMTYPPDEAELEKVLAACALFGSRIVALDNIASVLGCAPLDKVLTCDSKVALRVLGKSEMRELGWRALVVATGNNIILGADTARRALVCRLEPSVERPEERTGFRHRDLLAHVRAHRGRLVAAALTILRGFIAAGRPDAHSYTWGSFSAWAELVPAAIVWAGGANVLEARAVSLGSPDAEGDALRALLLGLPSLVPDGATAKTIVGALYPAERQRGEQRPPDGFDGLREALETLAPPKRPGDPPDARGLGKALRRYVGRIVAGRRLRASAGQGGIMRWAVEVMT